MRSLSLRAATVAGIATCAVLAFGGRAPFAGTAVLAQVPSSAPATSPTQAAPTTPNAGGGRAFARRGGGDSTVDARRRDQLARFLLSRTRNMASAKLGAAEVTAHVGKLATDSDDYRALAELQPGAVLELPGAAACKLRNEVGLRFGDTVVPTGNVSPGYAGLYSFWLRAPAAGSEQWSLVFNDEADVWGTQRDPVHDHGETPLVQDTTDVEAKELTVAIEAAASGDGGTLELRWGTHRWRAAFSVAP